MPSSDDTILQKADFGAIYDQPDPRAYYTTLAEHDYQIPQHGADVFDRLLQDRGADESREPSTVLDLCCSYGIVPTLLNTDLTMDDVTAHYGAERTAAMSDEELVGTDRDLLRAHRRPDPVRTIGIDIAKNAVEYAVEVGALDAGAVENLEIDDPSPRLAGLLADLDLITTTGGVGYVTERSFTRLLRHAPPTVSVAAFCLRTYDYGDVQAALDAHGLVTERAEGTVRQRRFTSAEEREWAVASVRERGFDPAGREDDGYYHAQLYVSRPADRVAQTPLGDLVPSLG
ncbi:hypothetical protein ACHAAC_17245 [Aeromicrobium sp. CF4.19]|uniref:hypothetical protein n=1 Tax=Aeromicrobium sp. CF4.19 TaxID=3373082 RepID=UPI003EE5835A